MVKKLNEEKIERVLFKLAEIFNEEELTTGEVGHMALGIFLDAITKTSAPINKVNQLLDDVKKVYKARKEKDAKE